MQEKKLRALIKHAYGNVEFYHKKFDTVKLKPDDIKSIDDLQELPITTKNEIQQSLREKMMARGFSIEKCKIFKTSGSTGKPLAVAFDKKADDLRAASFVRPFFENGVGFMDRIAQVGNPRTIPKKKKWYQHLGLNDRLYIPATENPERCISALAKYNPKVIYGYSSWIYLLARAIKEIGNRSISPSFVFGTAVVLTEEYRYLINSVFNTKMFDLYGCVEVERIAWECNEHIGYHMDIDNLVVEFLDGTEPVASGERGRIVLTCLYNYAMPIIRYDIGDLGIPIDEKCPCGRGFPLMKKIMGRADDIVVGQNGEFIAPENFANIMRTIPGIAQYQIVQETTEKILVRLVPAKDSSNITKQLIEEEIRNLLGSVQIDITVVREIPKDNSGKIRAVISKIEH